MTIREMETVTGLTRANIRFYEAQGLIAPERRENNYREYSGTDGEILLRIKLLRALGMTIEQIKALQNGSEHLIVALDRQIGILEQQRSQLDASRRVCREMREDNVSYASLDARRYLRSLEDPPVKPSAVIAQDTQPRIFAPWQRFWARALDKFVYTCILMTTATWLAKGAIPQWTGPISALLGIVMMLLLEPVQLRLFGTTLGKWIFGISVTDMDGRKLSLREGFRRTWTVLIYGGGLQVPGVQLWRYCKSYQAYENNEFLPWDDPSEVTVKDTRPVRYLAALGTAAAVFALSLVLTVLAQVPEHRGPLTVRQFCENYRKIANQEGMDMTRYMLHDDGTWEEVRDPSTVYIDPNSNAGPLQMHFTTDSDGKLVEVMITETIEGPQEGWIGARTGQVRLISLTMLMSQPEYNIFLRHETPILTAIAEQLFEDFRVSTCGVEFLYDVEYTGYWATSGLLIEDDDPETAPYYSMTFTVTKAE